MPLVFCISLWLGRDATANVRREDHFICFLCTWNIIELVTSKWGGGPVRCLASFVKYFVSQQMLNSMCYKASMLPMLAKIWRWTFHWGKKKLQIGSIENYLTTLELYYIHHSVSWFVYASFLLHTGRTVCPKHAANFEFGTWGVLQTETMEGWVLFTHEDHWGSCRRE